MQQSLIMKTSFADYVRSGHLQRNFDEAVHDATQEAQRLGLRNLPKTPLTNPADVTTILERKGEQED